MMLGIKNTLKTALLLTALAALFMLVGSALGGRDGVIAAFIIALIMQGFAYFFSDKLVLKLYKAQPLPQDRYAAIYQTVQELSNSMNMPMPTLWIINTPVANAFATGRNPKNASVAVTTGILEILTEQELRGVLAHELSHVYNRDILVSSIAAVLATSIGFIANMMQNAVMWGGASSNGSRRDGLNPFAMLFLAILMPIAATLIQLAISRSREYLADESGAHVCHDPLALAAALEKLERHTAQAHLNPDNGVQASTAHLFIVKPFLNRGIISSLFSTHPPMAARVERLRAMAKTMSNH